MFKKVFFKRNSLVQNRELRVPRLVLSDPRMPRLVP